MPKGFKRFQDQQSESSGEINISPLIDVVFILLIFFIVAKTSDLGHQRIVVAPEENFERWPHPPPPQALPPRRRRPPSPPMPPARNGSHRLIGIRRRVCER